MKNGRQDRIAETLTLFSTAPYGKERGWVDADWFRIDK